jgi:hypothetical protein
MRDWSQQDRQQFARPAHLGFTDALTTPAIIVIFMGRWAAGGSGGCGRGPAIGAATATHRRYESVADAGRLAGRSRSRKASGVRKAVISWICGPRRVSTSTARGMKVWVLSQA